MTNFTYETELGKYGENVIVSIDFQVKGIDFDDTDYTILKEASEMIEALGNKYKDLDDARLLNDGK